LLIGTDGCRVWILGGGLAGARRGWIWGWDCWFLRGLRRGGKRGL